MNRNSWTRRGTDGFLALNYCQGQQIVSLTDNSIALNLMTVQS
jgi:hypothetical protein